MINKIINNSFKYSKCLTLHPIIGNKKLNKFEAMEAINLSSSLEYDLIPYDMRQCALQIETNDFTNIEPGTYIKSCFGYGWVTSETCFEYDLYNNEQNEIIKTISNKEMENLLSYNTIKLKRINNLYFFSKDKLKSIAEFILTYNKNIGRNNPIDSLYINYLLTPLQIKNIKRLFNHKVEIYDRFMIILKIFQTRSSSNLTNYQTKLILLNYAKSLLKYEKDSFKSIDSLNSVKLLNNPEVKITNKTTKLEGETLREIQKRNIKNLEVKIKEKIKQIESFELNKIKKEFENVNLLKISLVS